MQLLEVEVKHWAGLTTSIGPLVPGLNQINGPNEAGKSRLFRAIRYAFFESYKGASQHKQELQSWHSHESPFVRVRFDDEGTEYTLKKQYLKGGYAELAGGGVTLRNEEAESRMRQILGARASGSRAVEAEMGIWPVLMIPQGLSRQFAAEALNDDSRNQLQSALAAEIGAAAISARGTKLMGLADQEYRKYFTASGQEGTTLRDARHQVAAAEAALAKAREAHAEQARTAAHLADARKHLTELGPRMELARQELTRARQRAEAARSADSRRQQKETAVGLARNRYTQAEQALDSRRSQAAEVGRLTGELDRCKAEALQLDQLVQHLRQAQESGAQRCQQCEDDWRRARDALTKARNARLAGELRGTVAQLADQIATLERLADQQQQTRDKRAALHEIKDEQLEHLRQLDQESRLLHAQVEGAAIRVGITAHRDITVNGSDLAAGVTIDISLTDGRAVDIADVAKLEIKGHLGSIDALRGKADKARSTLADALQACRADTLAAAIDANASWAKLTAEIASLERESRAVARKPLAELREQHRRQAEELARLGDIADALAVPTAQEAADAAERELQAARAARDAADTHLAKDRENAAALASQRASVEQQLEAAEKRLSELSAEADLESALNACHEARTSAQAELEEARRAYEDLGGDDTQADVERLERAADTLGKRQAESRSTVDQLQGALGRLIAAGSYDAASDAERQLDEARVALQRLLRAAGAAKRLANVLTEERQRVVEKLTAPVVARIRPYLSEIFPGSTLKAGENLEFTGLQTENIQEDFDDLSGGAQEQLALMTRIGMAEVLAGGKRLPMLLDDSLVNSDLDRIRLVHRALYRASRQLQIIVFTCHEPLFDGLGAEYQVRLPPTRLR